MFLQDVVNKNTVCLLVPPTSHLVAAPCNPVYALNTKLQALLIKGDTLETRESLVKDSSCWHGCVGIKVAQTRWHEIEPLWLRLSCLSRWAGPQLQFTFSRRRPESAFHLPFWRVWYHQAVYSSTASRPAATRKTELCHSRGILWSLPSAKVVFFLPFCHDNLNMWCPVILKLYSQDDLKDMSTPYQKYTTSY